MVGGRGCLENENLWNSHNKILENMPRPTPLLPRIPILPRIPPGNIFWIRAWTLDLIIEKHIYTIYVIICCFKACWEQMIRFYISKEDISLTRKTIVHFLLENKMMIENVHIIVSNLANIYIPSHTHTPHMRIKATK